VGYWCRRTHDHDVFRWDTRTRRLHLESKLTAGRRLRYSKTLVILVLSTVLSLRGRVTDE
jgi:hypothetical protein